MGFLESCVLSPLSKEVLEQSRPFSCGDADLDDFFLNDASNYHRQLLGKSYCYRLKADATTIVGAFTLANAGVESKHLPNSRKKKLTTHIPHEKQIGTYPSLLIGRLGVSGEYRKKGIGSEVLDFVKRVAIHPDNWSSCRFLTVDAYNNEATRKFYESNGFLYLFSTEEQEKEHIGMPAENYLKTRLMYFDLIRLQADS
jgi:GNAT superfamily N-acetyltransferase